MVHVTDRRVSGILAVAAGILGLLLLPLVTAAYGVADAGEGTDPSWGAPLRDAGGALFTFTDSDRVYSTYGLLYVLVVAGLLLGLLAARAERDQGRSGVERWGFRLATVGLALNLLGLVTDYTVFEGTLVENVGFAAGTLLGLLLLLVGGALLGLRWVRDPAAPRMAGAALLLALPGMLLLGLLGFGNLPSMPLAWFALTGIPLGAHLVQRDVAEESGLPAEPA